MICAFKDVTIFFCATKHLRTLRQCASRHYNSRIMEQKEEIAARHPVPPVEKKETMKESVLDFVRFVVLALAAPGIRIVLAQVGVIYGAEGQRD